MVEDNPAEPEDSAVLDARNRALGEKKEDALQRSLGQHRALAARLEGIRKEERTRLARTAAPERRRFAIAAQNGIPPHALCSLLERRAAAAGSARGNYLNTAVTTLARLPSTVNWIATWPWPASARGSGPMLTWSKPGNCC